MSATRTRLVDTPSGPARLHVEGEGTVRLVLGHGAGGGWRSSAGGGRGGSAEGRANSGAGGGVDAPDLLAARDAALALGMQVVRVEQPWRVAGRRVAEAPPRLDAAWLAALAALPGAPCVLGGRSSGARVACRTAGLLPAVLGVLGVLCLGFPLQPPGGPADRAAELAMPRVPRLVVQGARDGFGIPAPAAGLEVRVVRGADHGFAVRRLDGRTAQDVADEVRRTVQDWLVRLL